MEYKLKPITAENDYIFIHPLRPTEVMRQEEVAEELLTIFSNPVVKQYSPDKYTTDKKLLSTQLFGVSEAYQQELGYTHYVTWKDTNEIIAQVEIITPKRAETVYPKKGTWFLEYYLSEEYWGNGMMTDVIKTVVSHMSAQGIQKIAAVCMPSNKASIRVLEKSGFKRTGPFDAKQDIYELPRPGIGSWKLFSIFR